MIIGIDLGTTNIKTGVFSDDLKLLFSTTVPSPVSIVKPGAEMDPNQLWDSVCKAINICRNHFEVFNISGIGLTGMAEAGCLINNSLKPESQILLWYDRRGSRQAAELRYIYGKQIYEINGLEMTNVRSLAKWMWMINNGAKKTARWCGVPEWVGLKMTGNFFTDRTLAARTGAFDLKAMDYSENILSLAGANRNIFAPVLPAPAKVGNLKLDICQLFGIDTRPAVYIAGHDDIVAAYGIGARHGDLVNSAGTGEALIKITDQLPDLVDIRKSKIAISPFFSDHYWALIKGVGATGALIKQLSLLTGTSLHEIDELVTHAHNENKGEVIIKLSEKRLPVIHFPSESKPEDIYNQAFEVIVKKFYQSFLKCEQFQPSARKLIIFGGGAASENLSNRKAASVNLPYERFPNLEASILGAASIATGSISVDLLK